MATGLTSEEVNFLVYRYLLESGFVHSAYAFGHESFVAKSNIDSKQVPPGALISFVQKGLQYVEMEAHINEDGTETLCDASFNVMSAHTCNSSKRKQIFDPYEPIQVDYGELELEDDQVWSLRGHTDLVTLVLWHPQTFQLVSGSLDESLRFWDFAAVRKGVEDLSDDDDDDMKEEKEKKADTANSILCYLGMDKGNALLPSISSTTANTEAADASEDEKDHDTEEDTEDEDKTKSGASGMMSVKTEKTSGEKCVGSKKPQSKKAKSSGTGIKNDSFEPSNKKRRTGPSDTEPSLKAVSGAVSGGTPEKALGRSVVSGNWNGDGTMLACGDYSGVVSVWNDKGELLHEFKRHTGPVSCVRWNQKGNYLLSGSIDGVVALWEIGKAKLKQVYRDHTGPVLDCDWRSEAAFTTSSADGTIWKHMVATATGSKALTGHTGEVNAVRWCPQGKLLASCSDDKTVKLWSVSSDTCVASAALHTKGVTCLGWSNTGPNTANAEVPLLLATGSLDASVRVWDVQDHVLRCVHTLKQHTHPSLRLLSLRRLNRIFWRQLRMIGFTYGV